MNKKTVIANTVEWESIHISIPEDYMEYFDFIDLGAKNGKMEEYAQKTFNGQRGLHFEIDEECIRTMEEKGISCVQADVTNLTFPKNCVDFVISTGTIEHLMDLDAVKKMIEISINAAKDFVYLTWPWFDSDDYLKDLGFIPFPSTWDIHSCHVYISDLKKILKELIIKILVMKNWLRNYLLDSLGKEQFGKKIVFFNCRWNFMILKLKKLLGQKDGKKIGRIFPI